MCLYHYWDVTQQLAIVYLMWTFVKSNPKLYLNPLPHVAGSGEDCWKWWIVYLTTRWIRKVSDSSVIALSYDNVATLMMLHGCENWHNIMVECFMMCGREALYDDLSGHYCLQCDIAAQGWIQWRDCMLPLSKLSRLECIVWGKPMYYNNKLWGQKLATSDQKPRQCWSCYLTWMVWCIVNIFRKATAWFRLPIQWLCNAFSMLFVGKCLTNYYLLATEPWQYTMPNSPEYRGVLGQAQHPYGFPFS